jgi:hypothetical protein
MNDILATIIVALITDTLLRELPDHCEPDYYKNWSTRHLSDDKSQDGLSGNGVSDLDKLTKIGRHTEMGANRLNLGVQPVTGLAKSAIGGHGIVKANSFIEGSWSDNGAGMS